MGISLMVECESCKEKFSVDSSVMGKKEYIGKRYGESIWITYYDCPSCGRRHMVQVDNQVTNKLLSEIAGQMGIMARRKKAHETISKKQSAKFKRSRDDLAATRRNLIESYNKTYVYDESLGQEVLLVFSV